MSNGALPPAAVLVAQTVSDFDKWKSVFDENEQARRAGGILGHHVNRGEDDPNLVTVYLAVADIDAARAFAASDDLRERMKQAGATGPPQLTWLTPVREAIVWDREVPAFMLSHHVADFDRWLDGYDAAASLQKAGGIIGQAANRSLDDPSLAVVYHQAETFDTLREFLDMAELKEVMAEAGVVSTPEVTFWTGGWAGRYT